MRYCGLGKVLVNASILIDRIVASGSPASSSLVSGTTSVLESGYALPNSLDGTSLLQVGQTLGILTRLPQTVWTLQSVESSLVIVAYILTGTLTSPKVTMLDLDHLPIGSSL